MEEKQRILGQLAAMKPDLFARYQITSMALFGSIARGEIHEESDVDLLVEFSEVPDLLTFIDLERQIEKVLNRNVDLVPARKLRKEIAEQIRNESIAV